MAKSLLEYADWLDGREDLVWPKPPRHKPITTQPRLKKLRGIRAVVWNVYGTLLRITDGRLLFRHPQMIRMQVALEKTAREFNMWNSMYRKPGAPWEYLLGRYEHALEKQEMVQSAPGEFPEVNSTAVWKTIIRELERKEYKYDAGFYGGIDSFSEKVAFYFHASLQGLAAEQHALKVARAIGKAGLVQGLFADAQPFTPVQMLRAFRAQSKLPPPVDLFAAECSVLSFQEGFRKPSRSLFRTCLSRFEKLDIGPAEILLISSHLQEDLVPAAEQGMRTALFVGDGLSLEAATEEADEPDLKPDCTLTDFIQLSNVIRAS
jgi:FMN phosphatase YigB (HAD superfamily)